MSPKEVEAATAYVSDLLAKGWIQPSTYPWGAPIMFVPKHGGKLRACINYTGLNDLTVRDEFPLPRIDALLDQLSGSTIFSSCDLYQGYHQLKLDASDVFKTAFTAPAMNESGGQAWGHWEYKVLPLGLRNAVSAYQRAMTRIFAPFLGKFVVIYLDDICVFSKTPEEHLDHLRQVFELLRKYRLCCNSVKCHFNLPELKFLGHIVGREGVKPDPSKLAVVKQWPQPTDLHELRKFLGLCNYFSKFIKGYSSAAAPLTALTASDSGWHWNPEHQASFELLKDLLTSAPVLALPDLSKPFQVIADASLMGTGAVLMQEGRPVAFYSHKFGTAEKNYATGDQELLAIILALKEWRCYLEGAVKVELVSDHQPICYLKDLPMMSRRQARWLEFVTSHFDFEWKHIAGRSNVADPISRTVPIGISPGALLPTDNWPIVLLTLSPELCVRPVR